MRTYIPLEEAANDWMKYPKFRAEYEALESEFVLASASIRDLGEAGFLRENTKN